jgi:CRP-like cAMP-binding protein
MKTDFLFALLAEIHPCTDAFKEALASRLSAVEMPRNHHLYEAGHAARYLYFLHRGFVVHYTYREGEKAVTDFGTAGHVIIDVDSFFNQQPASEFVQMVTPGVLWCLSHDAVMHLFDSFDEAHVVYRNLLHRSYAGSRLRIRELTRDRAEDRYTSLLRRFPGMEQVVAQEDIASYLGITPQSLSRIKRRNRGR